ncbi:hypothetical protein Prudu_021137 [Prunus dulcis]|uniref:Uncharacterized protein n=1 Tax=Prunus dulcis TaxID=3755 RepID=A0A4Y1RWR2_PRUDU|nr:hypothetical protein Prudu_021137 [Prunus dulcis]
MFYEYSHCTTKSRSITITTLIDLSKQFKEFMHVSCSASNGQGSSVHIVDRWRFKTLLTEGDCFMCSSSEDLASNYAIAIFLASCCHCLHIK